TSRARGRGAITAWSSTRRRSSSTRMARAPCASGCGQVRPLRRLESAPGAPAPFGSYNLAVVYGGVVYVAGQVAVDESGTLVGGDDALAQARQAYANLDAVLRAAGSDLRRLLKLTVFLTDMANLDAAARARREFVPADALPASTLVEVSRLADPRWLIEVEAVAALAAPRGRGTPEALPRWPAPRPAWGAAPPR